RNDQRKRRCLVLRVQRVDGRHRLDRLRSTPYLGNERDRGGGRVTDLDELHGEGLEGRSGAATAATRRHPRGSNQSRDRLARGGSEWRHPRVLLLGISAAGARRRPVIRYDPDSWRSPEPAVLSSMDRGESARGQRNRARIAQVAAKLIA